VKSRGCVLGATVGSLSGVTTRPHARWQCRPRAISPHLELRHPAADGALPCEGPMSQYEFGPAQGWQIVPPSNCCARVRAISAGCLSWS
jgi:hypothetical protein